MMGRGYPEGPPSGKAGGRAAAPPRAGGQGARAYRSSTAKEAFHSASEGSAEPSPSQAM
jgi:hypothetical protein